MRPVLTRSQELFKAPVSCLEALPASPLTHAHLLPSHCPAFFSPQRFSPPDFITHWFVCYGLSPTSREAPESRTPSLMLNIHPQCLVEYPAHSVPPDSNPCLAERLLWGHDGLVGGEGGIPGGIDDPSMSSSAKSH